LANGGKRAKLLARWQLVIAFSRIKLSSQTADGEGAPTRCLELGGGRIVKKRVVFWQLKLDGLGTKTVGACRFSAAFFVRGNVLVANRWRVGESARRRLL
jgi:hypothetical protein